jgi:hypothetical protein
VLGASFEPVLAGGRLALLGALATGLCALVIHLLRHGPPWR